MKTKAARIQAGNNGGVKVVLNLTPEIVSTAEKLAERLQVSREDVLTHYFADSLEHTPDGMSEFCLAAWAFPSKAKAEAFIEREGLNPRQYVAEQWESGGWSVTDKAQYLVVSKPRRERKAAA